ncbi:MAG: serine/threonine-protein kinase [Pseudomonadota bacterium]
MASDNQTRRVLALCDEALEQPVESRDEFIANACGADTTLFRAVSSILDAATAVDGFLADSAMTWASNDLTGQEVGGYHIQSLLGEGGMGAVFRATKTRDGFTQEVALKLIRGRFAAPELIDRFNAERAILARLNHPYIARLIDGGTDRGAPFLVMEYIDGQPVDEYLDERQVDIDGRIRLVQKIAQAVHAAHQNLVIHRDLKPSNVLVTDDGIPKLLDFGIAKLLDDANDSEPGNTTVYGRSALTPDFASPEQLLDNRTTTASDVYSLGVLTYRLLVGVQPYYLERSTQRAVLDSIERVAVPKPSERIASLDDPDAQAKIAANRSTTPARLNARLADDLDRIVMKALAQDPAQRYASVAAFNADLERFLCGEPVEARPDSLGYRVRRFVARNRLAVGFSAALVATLIGALAITSRLYLQAEQARADAAARFDQVRSLATTMMFDVYDEIEKVPGSVSARRLLASTAQRYLDGLQSSDDAPFGVRLDAGLGFARLAAILNRQAVTDVADRGDASTAYEQAERLLLSLEREAPGDAAVSLAVGELYAERARQQLYIDNEPEAAGSTLDSALEWLQQAQTVQPDNVDVEAARLMALEIRADRFKWLGDYSAARDAAIDVATLAREAAARHGTDPRFSRVVGDAEQLLGEAHYYLDAYDDAVAAYTAAIAAYDQAIARGGPDRAITDALVTAQWSRGNTRFDMEQPAAAADDYQVAIDLTELVVATDPNDAASARQLAILKGSQAMAWVKTGRRDEGIARMLETNAWFEAQAAADPDTASAQRSLAVSYYVLGDVYDNAGDSQNACRWFRRSLEKWQAIDARFGLAEFDAGEPERIRGVLADCD